MNQYKVTICNGKFPITDVYSGVNKLEVLKMVVDKGLTLDIYGNSQRVIINSIRGINNG